MTATETDPVDPRTSRGFDTIELALQEIADGGLVIVVDH